MSRQIGFFLEFDSPYSCLAARKPPQPACRSGRGLRRRPVEIVKILEAQGLLQAQTAIRRARVGHIVHDAARPAADEGAPFASVRRLRDTVWARRTVHRLSRRAPDALEAFALAAWRKLFAQGGVMDQVEAPAPAAPAWVGPQIEAAAADEQAASDRDAANATQCFGAPRVVADGEVIFGQDRLGLLARHLAQEVVTA